MKPDKTSDIPLYIQIRDSLREEIRSGARSAGDRLPPVTVLAAEKSVTPATVRRALQDLSAEGLITSHVGRGTFVSSVAARAQPAAHPQESRPEAEPPSHEAIAAGNRLRANIARSLSDLLGLSQRPGIIAFTRGIGDPDTVERGTLTRLATRALESGEEIFWDYGDPRGLPSLRTAIADLYRARGLDVGADHVLVTSGSQQAIALVAQQAAETSARVLCETPCYGGVTSAFAAYGLWTEPIVRDDEGPSAAALVDDPRLENSYLYLCPVLHNPMGLDVSPARGALVSAWARRNGVTLVSDEVFRDLHAEGPEPASFLADPGPESAIVLGSLSKSFISGLRVGWLVSSEERVRELARIKKTMDLGCPPLMQGIAEAFIRDKDGLAAHRERVRAHYLALRDVTLASLESSMPQGVSWTRPAGGFQLWVTLPQGYSSVALYLRAIERGVAFLPGPMQDADGRFANSFRLCYGSLRAEEIRAGIRILGEATREFLASAPGDAGSGGLGYV